MGIPEESPRKGFIDELLGEKRTAHLPRFCATIRRAPYRELRLSGEKQNLALKNALRYLPQKWHAALLPEFKAELEQRGRIYGYRFRPNGRIKAKCLEEYKGSCLAGRSLQLMIDNNLDFETALYPYELVTYGETGQVCLNWMQYHLIKDYLERLTEQQTLVIQSGHPLGLFPSSPSSPRVIITNALMVGLYDNPSAWHDAAALGVANYGQMTAGGWMYIGPQGIVHGTFNTLLLAGRKHLGTGDSLECALFISSGLGGMSGAQGKAAKIAGGVAIIAEVDKSRVETRLSQGWIDEVFEDKKAALHKALECQRLKKPTAIAFQGNIIDLLEAAVEMDVRVDLLSDQTSCHAPYDGGYCPLGLSFSERTDLLKKSPSTFHQRVNESLKRHYRAVATLVERGAYFFDYGNAFMKAILDTGETSIAANKKDDSDGFIWPSYIEDLMGPELFDLGYGPFRWVCLSGKDEDLAKTDHAAAEVIADLRSPLRQQDLDNLKWVREAEGYKLVVGSKARILYQDGPGRVEIALRFNEMVRKGEVDPIMLGRDHHDVSGTDSPFRETSNIYDGSRIMADMATQCFAGNAARGMTLVALHNGGGTGIGKSINGGFALLLDGRRETDEIIKSALSWDVYCGVARRAWLAMRMLC